MIQNLNNVFALNILPTVALIYADEEYLPLINLVTDHLKVLSPNHHLHKFEADRYFDITQIEQLVVNTSLLDTTNYIEISYKTKPVVEHHQRLADIVKQLDENNFLCIVTAKLNRKELTSTWVEAINRRGIITTLNETNLKTLITLQLAKYGLKVTANAANLLIEQNQTNALELLQELNKLTLLYKAGTTIDTLQIQGQDNAQYNIYQLSRAYLSGNLNQSLKILQRIYATPEDAILINWLIHEDIKKLLQIKNKIRQKINLNQAILEVKRWGDDSASLAKALDRLNYQRLLSCLESLAQLDLLLKGVIDGDIAQNLTQIIILLCKKDN